MLQMLVQQRNAALDQAANMAGQLALVTAQLNSALAQIPKAEPAAAPETSNG